MKNSCIIVNVLFVIFTSVCADSSENTDIHQTKAINTDKNSKKKIATVSFDVIKDSISEESTIGSSLCHEDMLPKWEEIELDAPTNNLSISEPSDPTRIDSTPAWKQPRTVEDAKAISVTKTF